MKKILPIGLDISALNPNFKQHASRGIGRYVRELNGYFSSLDHNNTISTFTVDEFLPSDRVSCLLEALPVAKQTIKQQVVFPLNLFMKGQNKFSFMHFPAHMDAPSWSATKTIVTVLDLIPVIFKDLYKSESISWRFHLARYLEMRAIKNASHLIAISECTKHDVHEVLGIPLEKISVTHLGVDDSFFFEADTELKNRLRSKFGISKDSLSILYVGGIDPRKNIPKLLEAFQVLSEMGTYDIKLILAGNIKQDKSYCKLEALINSHNNSKNIIQTGFIEDKELKALYQVCSVFCFPSLYEGFGLPVLEAFASKIPVVCGNNSCMPEVVGDQGAAIMVNVSKPSEIAAGIIKAYLHKNELIQKGFERAKEFTWSKTGEKTLKVYESLLNPI